MNKYQELTKDIRQALDLAKTATKTTEDDGEAVQDAVFIRLPNWRAEKVTTAINLAGAATSGKINWIGYGFLVAPPDVEANKRIEMVQEMREHLANSGYDVTSFCMKA